MNNAPAPDPGDWRTWRRDGVRLFPPPGTTDEQAVLATDEYSLARWGVDPNKPRNDHRNVIGVRKKVGGRYALVSYARVVDGRKIDIRVRGGCRS